MKVIALSVLIVVAALSLTGLYFAVSAVPGAVTEFEQEPEDLGILVFLACLGLFLLGYCLSGIVKTIRKAHGIGALGYVCSGVAGLLSVAMIALGAFDGGVQRTENVVLGILIALCVGAYVYLGHSGRRRSSNETEFLA